MEVSPSVTLFPFTQNHSVCCTGMFTAGVFVNLFVLLVVGENKDVVGDILRV